MLDLLNATTCVVILVMMVPVAKAMSNRGMWGRRFGFWLVLVVVGLQAFSPTTDVLPSANWLQVALNVLLLIGIATTRHDLMALVRTNFGDEAAAKPSVKPRVLYSRHFAQARGKGGEA